MQKKPNSYELSRAWFDFCFENPEKIKPNHTAVYFFAIEHCNRLAWKVKFGFPSTMAMEAIGIKSYNTYIKTLNDLVEWGFIKMVEKSKNQYSSNIISLGGALLKNDKALDKALIKHATKQSESTVQSIDSINKQDNKETIEQYNPELATKDIEEIDHTLWLEWIAHKKKNKLALTKRAINKNINTLRKIGLDLANQVIEDSIDSNWKDLYLKDKNNDKPVDKKQEKKCKLTEKAMSYGELDL